MSVVKRFAKNVFGADLIVGDIHGHFSRLEKALKSVGFDPDGGDRLFSVGDLVDRGPDSDKAMEWIEKPWFHAVQGNHEDFAIRWPNGFMEPDNYLRNGGGWNIANPPELQREISEAFSALPVAIEIETDDGRIGIVHADCPCRSWADFTHALETGYVRNHDGSKAMNSRERDHLVSMAQWSRERISSDLGMPDVQDIHAVVVGHTPVKSPMVLGNVHYIDTGGWLPEMLGHGSFTLLDARTLKPFKHLNRVISA